MEMKIIITLIIVAMLGSLVTMGVMGMWKDLTNKK
jgi:hypothetical protein